LLEAFGRLEDLECDYDFLEFFFEESPLDIFSLLYVL